MIVKVETEGSREEQLSYDVASGVNSFKHDLEHFGYILPETRTQVRDEQLSFICEGIDKASRTEFSFRRYGEELVHFDEGRWRSHREMLETGLTVARHTAAVDPRREFQVHWCETDIYQYDQFKRLKPGEKHTWISLYPLDMEERYGPEFMKHCGLNPDRRLGFIYQATGVNDGTIKLESQTIDRSDVEAAAAVLDALEDNPQLDLDLLVDIYDRKLEIMHEVRFYAGRTGHERVKNAWRELTANHDLISYLMDGLEALATKSIGPNLLNRETKRHIYGVWALFSKRLEGTAERIHGIASVDYTQLNYWLSREVNKAFKEFAVMGRAQIGCGGTISFSNGGESIFDAPSSEVLTSIFGKGKYGKTEVMKCVHCPLCKKDGVDATIKYNGGNKTITCSRCHKSKSYRT